MGFDVSRTEIPTPFSLSSVRLARGSYLPSPFPALLFSFSLRFESPPLLRNESPSRLSAVRSSWPSRRVSLAVVARTRIVTTFVHNTHPVLTLFRLPLDYGLGVSRPYGDARPTAFPTRAAGRERVTGNRERERAYARNAWCTCARRVSYTTVRPSRYTRVR